MQYHFSDLYHVDSKHLRTTSNEVAISINKSAKHLRLFFIHLLTFIRQDQSVSYIYVKTKEPKLQSWMFRTSRHFLKSISTKALPSSWIGLICFFSIGYSAKQLPLFLVSFTPLHILRSKPHWSHSVCNSRNILRVIPI